MKHCTVDYCQGKFHAKGFCKKHWQKNYRKLHPVANDEITAHGKTRKRGLNGLAQAARNKGLKIYYTNKPCKYGHNEGRFIQNNLCIKCHRIYTTKRRQTVEWKEQESKRRQEKRLKYPWRNLYHSAKSRAAKLDIEFNLTMEYVESIWPKDNKCPVFGWEMKPNVGQKCQAPNSPNLDRVDRAKGYIVGNVAVLSSRANQIKSIAANADELRKVANWLEEIQKEYI